MATLDGQQIPKWLLSSSRPTEAQMAQSLGTLFGYSLISKHAEPTMVSVHPLVQASARYRLQQEGRDEVEAQQALPPVADVFPDSEYEN